MSKFNETFKEILQEAAKPGVFSQGLRGLSAKAVRGVAKHSNI